MQFRRQKASMDSLLKAYLLKVQWTVAHFILAGHATISLSSERRAMKVRPGHGFGSTGINTAKTHIKMRSYCNGYTDKQKATSQKIKKFSAKSIQVFCSHPDKQMHTWHISACVQCQSSHGLCSALFSSRLGNRARPQMPVLPSNPLSFNNRPGQAEGSRRSPSSFIRVAQQNNTVHRWRSMALASISALSYSWISSLCLSVEKWSMMLRCSAVCMNLSISVTARVEEAWKDEGSVPEGEAGTWRWEIRLVSWLSEISAESHNLLCMWRKVESISVKCWLCCLNNEELFKKKKRRRG